MLTGKGLAYGGSSQKRGDRLRLALHYRGTVPLPRHELCWQDGYIGRRQRRNTRGREGHARRSCCYHERLKRLIYDPKGVDLAAVRKSRKCGADVFPNTLNTTVGRVSGGLRAGSHAMSRCPAPLRTNCCSTMPGHWRQTALGGGRGRKHAHLH